MMALDMQVLGEQIAFTSVPKFMTSLLPVVDCYIFLNGPM